LASGYVWAVEVMAGLTPWQVVEATRTAYAEAVPGQERWITVTPGLTAYLAPFFYPEMVELVAQLLLHKSDVWIVSASNVWSVRWMVQYGLNPRLRSLGVSTGLAADHVLGVATLLSDEAGHLYKDSVRVRENPAYAALQEPELSRLHLTSRLQFPVPIYSGKIACLWEVLPVRPWLAAGDSPGDHALLRYSEHRLWLARLEKLAYQQATWDLLRRTGGEGWMVQPVLAHTTPGFLSEPVDLARWSGDSSSKVRASLELLQSPPMPAIW
jgi:hypothetical protein